MTAKSKLRIQPLRSITEREDCFAVLREARICHVSFIDEGWPYCIPTAFGFSDEAVYLHGSARSRMLKVLATGSPCTITITHTDGLVIARSIFHHSMNYRSVCIFGHGSPLEGDSKVAALKNVSNHLAAGRWENSREPTTAELKATSVVAIAIEQMSGKTRVGPPKDDEADLALPYWAGELPMRTIIGEPIAACDQETPEHIRQICMQPTR